MEYLKRFERPLTNPSSAEMALRDPLMTFSFYLSGRVAVLCHFADEILENLDSGFATSSADMTHISRAESLMWLWLLGAYEVVRTMLQGEQYFSKRVREDLRRLKRPLAAVRMPAAKMEKPGKRNPVTSSRSAAGLDVANRDLLVNDPDDQTTISARWLIAEFDRVFTSIGKSDILARHEDAYRVRT